MKVLARKKLGYDKYVSEMLIQKSLEDLIKQG